MGGLLSFFNGSNDDGGRRQNQDDTRRRDTRQDDLPSGRVEQGHVNDGAAAQTFSSMCTGASQWNASKPSPAAVRQRKINMTKKPTPSGTTESVPVVRALGGSSAACADIRDAGYSSSGAWDHNIEIKHWRGKVEYG